MKIYRITQTELVTRHFRVIADSEEDALTVLGDEMDFPQVTENCELLEQSTLSREVEFSGIPEEYS